MKVFVSLGERSASNYIYNIFKDIKGIDLYGITDERLESIGFKSVARIEDLSVVGLIEALPELLMLTYLSAWHSSRLFLKVVLR